MASPASLSQRPRGNRVQSHSTIYLSICMYVYRERYGVTCACEPATERKQYIYIYIYIMHVYIYIYV